LLLLISLQNRYLFERNNPISNTDPFGKADAAGIILGASIGAAIGVAVALCSHAIDIKQAAIIGAVVGAIAVLALDINVALKLIQVFGNTVDFQITAYSRLFNVLKLALGWTPRQGWHINFATEGHLYLGPIALVLALLTIGLVV